MLQDLLAALLYFFWKESKAKEMFYINIDYSEIIFKMIK